MIKHPISIQQKTLWYRHKLFPADYSLNVGFAFRMSGKIDFNLFTESLAEVCIRNGILQMIFEEDAEGGPMHYASTEAIKIHFQKIDEEEVMSFLQSAYREPFKLSEKCPVARYYFLQIDNITSIFLFVVHHIVFDFYSTRIFLNELATEYAGRITQDKKKYHVKKEPYPVFPDRQALLYSDTEQHKNFWIEYLSGKNTALKLPGDNSTVFAKNLSDFSGDVCIKHIGTEMMSAVVSRARKSGSSIFSVLFSTFCLALYNYTDTSEFIIGSPFLGRDRESMSSIGYFSNVLPVKFKCNRDQSFADFQKACDESISKVKNRHLTPPECIRKWCPEIDQDFGVLFSYLDQGRVEKSASGILREIGILSENIDLLSQENLFDFVLEAKVREREVQLNFKFRTALYSKSFVDCFSERYLSLLNKVTVDESATLGELIKTDYGLISTQSALTTGHDFSITEIFHAKADMLPDKTAIVWKDTHLSFREASTAVKRCSAHLERRLGIKPGSTIGLSIDRSHYQIIGILSVLDLTCTYVPILTNIPDSRIAYIIKNAGLTHILSDRLNYNRISVLAGDIPVTLIEDIYNAHPELPRKKERFSLDPVVTPAYIMYTSGSTGYPKGVAVMQGSVVNLARNKYLIKVREGDIVFNLSNYAFDGSVFDIFSSLLNGATLILTTANKFDVSELKKLAIIYPGSTVFVPTALFHALIDSSPDVFDLFKTVLVGGESLSPTHARRLLSRAPLELIHGYGPTECTVFTTYFKVEDIKAGQIRFPIGKPLDGVEVRIVDRLGNILPDYSHGEITIGGNCLAEGYIGNSSESSRCFIENDTGRWYMSGDIGYRMSDGNIMWVGRKDSQIKHNGFRIELSEIEHVIMRYKGIRNAVVRQGIKNSDSVLIAIVESIEKQHDDKLIKSYLSQYLPVYMIPLYIVFGEIPVNVNGKIDQSAIERIIQHSSFNDIRKVRAAVSSTEVKISNIFQEFLNLSDMSMDDNFNKLGGESITALKIVARINKELNTQLVVTDILNVTTISDLCKLAEERQSLPGVETGNLIKRVDRIKYKE